MRDRILIYKNQAMGMYRFINAEDRITMRKVSDPAVNEDFQEALKYQPLLMIQERVHVAKRSFWSSWFSEAKPETHYQIYHETPAWDGSPYQARYQISGSGSKEIVTAYLHGIVNGAASQLESIHQNNHPK